jgi:hypothetical protein
MQRFLALCFLLIIASTPVVRAQQTIFNVPSQDVLAPGAVYGEVDIPFRIDAPKFVAITPRVVVGLGYNFEGGLNLPGYINVGDKLWTAQIVLKHGESLDTAAPWTLTEGAHALIPITSNRETGLFGYVMTGYKLFGHLRLNAGLYGATQPVTGTKDEVGALGSIEYTVTDWLTVAADGYSGKNALSYVSPGLFLVPFANCVLYPAYQISNVSRDLDSYLLEIGYTF